jgi:hypothetical protein
MCGVCEVDTAMMVSELEICLIAVFWDSLAGWIK